MRSSIRVRLTVAFMGLAIGPLLLVGVALAWRSYTIQQQQALYVQRQVAHRVATQVTAFFTELENELQMVSKVQGLATMDREKQHDILADLLLFQHVFEELILLDRQGQERTHVARSSLTPTSLGGRAQADEFVIPQTREQLYYSPVRFEEIRGEPLVTLAVPLADVRTGLVDGVLVSEVRMKTIWELVADVGVSPGQRVYIVDAQDNIVAHRNPSVVLRGTRFHVPTQDGIQPGLTGSSVVLASHPVRLGEQVLHIVVEQAWSEALALAISMVLITLTLVAATLGISGTLGFFIVRQIVRPIQMMATTAQAIMAGDLSQQVHIPRHDELGLLATVFNSMTTQLRGLITDLEQRVTARTASLQQANAQLHQEIAERQRTEQALQQAKDIAETATRAKSDFLAAMSHEIRTPMNAILGMAELLRETALTTEQRDYVERFYTAGEHLLDLINAVLDLAKIEAGHLEFEHIPFDLEDLLHTVGELMGGRAAAKGLELLSLVAPDVPTHLIGDPARLRQILINLVGNAIKFTETGDVVLRVENAPEAHTSGALRFSVRDTGIGIPTEKLAIIFERFTQVDVSTTRKYGGTGLGLSISQRLVHGMNGQIWVESQAGSGSTFFFTVRCEIDAAPVPRGTAFFPQLHGLRVLVIDDNATNRLIVREILRPYGAYVTEAGGAEAGLAAWAQAQHTQQTFHVVLVDSQMPDKDGFYFIEQLSQRHKHDTGTILMLSSDNRPGDRARYQLLGVGRYLLKPISRPVLCRTIAEAVHRQNRAPAPPTPVTASPAVPPDRPLHILIAEDNEDNQMLLRSYLKTTSHQLTIAENGLVAVEQFKVGTYDLVLMDVQMPIMDGYSATVSIRQWERAEHRPPTRIIALTANALAEDRQKSLHAGCDGHLTKPIKKATLLAAISAYAASPTPPGQGKYHGTGGEW